MHESNQTTHQRNATGACWPRCATATAGPSRGAVVTERRRRNRAARKARRTHRLAAR